MKASTNASNLTNFSEQEDEDAEVKAWAERPIYYSEMKGVIKQSMQTMQVADSEPPSSSQAEFPDTFEKTRPSTVPASEAPPTASSAPTEEEETEE